MVRKPIVAGNWKMHGSIESVKKLTSGILAGAASFHSVQLIVFPPYIHIPGVAEQLKNSHIQFGSQNVNDNEQGAHTGEVSIGMLKEFGCQYVLVGHSERRHVYGESNEFVGAKFHQVLAQGLTPIFCVGETLEQREAGITQQIVNEQIEAVLQTPQGVEVLKNAVIAYEPVWAIGTGVSASPAQAQQVHSDIRGMVAGLSQEIAQQLRILYGGSVKASNANELFNMQDIDGGLIGGASLDANEFLDIARAAG